MFFRTAFYFLEEKNKKQKKDKITCFHFYVTSQEEEKA
jgi:hypothetical protein